jgi:hypothetical protein
MRKTPSPKIDLPEFYQTRGKLLMEGFFESYLRRKKERDHAKTTKPTKSEEDHPKQECQRSNAEAICAKDSSNGCATNPTSRAASTAKGTQTNREAESRGQEANRDSKVSQRAEILRQYDFGR